MQRIVYNFKWASLFFFWLAGSKHSQYLRIEPSEYVGFPYADWWRDMEREGRKIYLLRENHSPECHPTTPTQVLLNGIPYAGL
jgi:hypothetical protein